MEGVHFGWLTNAMGDPDVRYLPPVRDLPPEFGLDLPEDASPLTDPRLPEEPGRGISRRGAPLEHPPPI
jgi:hypothetical protein